MSFDPAISEVSRRASFCTEITEKQMGSSLAYSAHNPLNPTPQI